MVRVRTHLVLLNVLMLVLAVVVYHSSLFMAPAFIHTWAQADRYAIALQYLEHDLNFYPVYTYHLTGTDSATPCELPLHSYIPALLMALFKTDAPVIFRLYNLVWAFIAVNFTFLVAYRLLRPRNFIAQAPPTAQLIQANLPAVAQLWGAWLAALFLLLSPVWGYYSANFLPTVPCLGLTIVGLNCYVVYRQSNKTAYYILAIGLMVLAALSRLHYVVPLLALGLVELPLTLWRNGYHKMWLYKLLLWVAALCLPLLQHYWNLYLADLYGGTIFLTNPRPFTSWQQFIEELQVVYDLWFYDYFTRYHYTVLVVLVVVAWSGGWWLRRLGLFAGMNPTKSFTEWLKHNTLAVYALVLVGGALAYGILLGLQFRDHDYYFIDIYFIPLGVVLMVCLRQMVRLAEAVRLNSLKAIHSKVTLGFMAAVMGYLVVALSPYLREQNERYTFYDYDRFEVTNRAYQGADRFLDSLQVPRDAIVLVLGGHTVNMPLYQLRRKGRSCLLATQEYIQPNINIPYEYVVAETAFLDSEVLPGWPALPSLVEPLGSNGKISVFKRRK